MKEIVKLIKKPNKSGGLTLYLEFKLNGKRHQESLGLFLYPETTPIYKNRNKATMEAALYLQSQKTIQIQKGMAGLSTSSKKTLKEVCQSYIESRPPGNYRRCIAHALKWWIEANGDELKINEVTRDHMLKFSNILKKELAPASAATYYTRINTILNKAVRDGAISMNPSKKVDPQDKPKPHSPERQYLSIDEIQKLMSTPCPSEALKKAFFFSCFTGLRYSDIASLTWGNIDGNKIAKRMVKTREMIYMPLSANALAQLPTPGDAQELVFHLRSERQNIDDMKEWIKSAGITKKITFHCARHTFACLLLTYGTDIYTVSKLLGHKNIATTLIYAHMVDEKKVQAVNSIPTI